MAKTTRFFNLAVSVFCAAIIFAAPHADARGRNHVRHAKPAGPQYASIIMDAQTGRVLQEKNADAPLPPASLTKLMTLFLTFEALENGRIHMNKYLTVTPNAMRQPPSKLGLNNRTKITVKEAIYVLVTRSANDVAMALAETVGGSEKNFARMMTERAHSLGMKHSQFFNPSGLPNPRQKSSARDMAILARAIMQYFPQHYHFFKTIRFNYHGQTIETHNNLMRRFKGMDGMKTGYTYASGFNLVASSVRDNRRVIVAVFGGRTAVSRDNHVAELMNRGHAMLGRGQAATQFAAVKPVAPAPLKQDVATSVAVASNAPVAPVATARDTNSTSNQVTRTTKVAPIVATEKVIPSRVVALKPTPVSRVASNWSPDGGQVRTLQAPTSVTTVSAQPAPAANMYKTASYIATAEAAPMPATNKNWGIQVGAYSNASMGQEKLQTVQNRLRHILGNDGQAIVVPSTTHRGTIYRARIIGLSAQGASRACQALGDCLAFTVR